MTSWQQSRTEAFVDAVATRARTDGRAYSVRVVCAAKAQSPHRLRLEIVPQDGSTAFADQRSSPGSIRFGQAAPQTISWRYTGSAARATISDEALAAGLARVFKSQRPVTLAGFAGDSEPLRFIFGQGPYEPTVSDFLVGCPPTHDLMPTLVRIRRATLKPVPDSFENPGLPANPPPRYPPAAIANHESGQAKLVMALTPEGRVLWPVVVQSTGYDDLDRAARTAMAQWRFPEQPLGPDELYLFHQSLSFHLGNL